MLKSLIEGYLGLARDLVAKDHPYISACLAVFLIVMFFCAFVILVVHSPASHGVANAGDALAAIIRGWV